MLGGFSFKFEENLGLNIYAFIDCNLIREGCFEAAVCLKTTFPLGLNSGDDKLEILF
jgi:hypothetical protein